MSPPVISDLVCRDESRRQLIRERGKNGIDYVDVNGKHLCVHFITEIPPEFLPKEKGKALTLKEKDAALRHIVIHGGRRITGIRAIDFDPHDHDDTYEQDCLGIELDREGDFSTYTLCFVDVPSLDPRYRCIDFSFKIDCPAEIDCKQDDACPPAEYPRPAISYLAKDYATFRQLILDRLALLMPEWRERHVPDVGIAIVELLAYVGDYLSYYQDAVATEAYLDTARRRVSVRRHARLVDYPMHDGCNARAFLFLETSANNDLDLDDVFFVTRYSEIVTETALELHVVEKATGWLAFEPLEPRDSMKVRLAHNEIRIYTWGDQECCIPKGATRATLVDGWVEVNDPIETTDEHCPPPPPPEERDRLLDDLAVGDFLLFEELACAGTAYADQPLPAPDVDRTHRHVVRITKIERMIDSLNDQPVVDVEWSREDAMPFMLCVSAIGTAPQCDYVEPLAVARANILLVDHGLTIDEELDPVPEQPVNEVCEGEDDLSEVPLVAARYRPRLKTPPLTFAQPLIQDAPATVIVKQNPRLAFPEATLRSESPAIHGGDPYLTWLPQLDLLESTRDDLHFVAEIDDDGAANIRFGDGDAGRSVDAGMEFEATYRYGNGRMGLVGAESIVHIIFRSGKNDLIAKVRNPLPSTGAIDPESVAEVKMLAPMAFRKDLQRAITGEDYATLAQYMRYPVRNPRVQGAAAALAWSGSWYEAGVHVDPFGTHELSDNLRGEVETHLERYRRMGHDLRVGPARIVPLRLELDLCVKPKYLRAHVVAAVKEALKKFFHPDKMVFGESVYISRIVAAVMAVDGIAEVHVTRLERLGGGDATLKPNEIARLDNDPAQPENGILSFGNVRGGR